MNIFFRWGRYVILTCAFACFVPSVRAAAPAAIPTTRPAVVIPAALPDSQPMLSGDLDRLIIPSTKTNVSTVPVGVTKTGNLDVPPNYVQAGWYRYGAIPGQVGTAVIDGHVDNGGYRPSVDGVFKHLRDLAVGDDIYITDTNGSEVHFKVTNSVVYRTISFPSAQVFANTGQPLLKIITCHGTWNPKMGTYDQRLVVTAVRVHV